MNFFVFLPKNTYDGQSRRLEDSFPVIEYVARKNMSALISHKYIVPVEFVLS
jgi:hypothetical protein